MPDDVPPDRAAAIAAAFQQEDVTSVLYLASYPASYTLTRAFGAISYFPELMVAGDGYIDRGSISQLNEQRVWRNAWTVTPFQLREDESDSTPGFRACQEGDPTLARHELIPYCQFFYRDLFMLFQAIQIAGPELTPGSIDRGFHAIPPIESTDPYRASCYFEPDDYTCVKDAMEEWWDPDGSSPQDVAPGCWRMTAEGRRHWPETWAREDTVFTNRDDPCNGAGAFFAR